MALDPHEVQVATAAIRRVIDATGYGWYVSDAQCQQAAVAVDSAIVAYRAGLPKGEPKEEDQHPAQASKKGTTPS